MNINISQETNFLSRVDYAILNCILYSEAKHRYAWPSQSFIAHMIDSTREYVNRRIQKLVALGLLHKEYEAWTSCNYKISDLIKSCENIQQWLPRLPNLKYFVKKITLDLRLLMSDCHAGNHTYEYVDGHVVSEGRYSTMNIYTNYLYNYKSSTNSPSLTGLSTRTREGALERREEIRKNSIKKKNSLKKKEGYGIKGNMIYKGNVLTNAGWAELSGFELKVIEEAARRLNSQKATIIEPLGWLIVCCNNISRDRKIEVDYEKRDLARIAIAPHDRNNTWKKADEETLKHELRQEEPKKKREPAKEEMVTTKYSAEEVERHIQQLERNPFMRSLCGISPRELFKNELSDGEMVIRSKNEVEREKRVWAAHGNLSEFKQGSITTKEEGVSNGSRPDEEFSFIQIERGYDSGEGSSKGQEMPGMQPISGIMSDLYADGRSNAAYASQILTDEQDCFRSTETHETEPRTGGFQTTFIFPSGVRDLVWKTFKNHDIMSPEDVPTSGKAQETAGRDSPHVYTGS